MPHASHTTKYTDPSAARHTGSKSRIPVGIQIQFPNNSPLKIKTNLTEPNNETAFTIGRDVPPLTMELDDGTPVLLRPVLPDDRERVRIAIEEMSRESRYRRFFTSTMNPSADLLRYFTEVDKHHHVAWGALDPSVEGQPGVGIARFIRDRDDPTVAEVAFTVRDDLQGLGLGTILLAILYHLAPVHGIKTLRANVLADSYSVADWLRSLGARGKLESGVLEFDLMVSGHHSKLQQTPGTERFRQRLQEVTGKLQRGQPTQ